MVYVYLFLFGFLFHTAQSSCSPNNNSTHHQQNYEVVFFEDFLGTTLNATRWAPYNNRTHCAPCEDANYMASNVHVSNGSLFLITERNKTIGPQGQTFNFTSGWVEGLPQQGFSWMYGKFEVRARLPSQKSTGAWPAHWLMPASSQCWPTGGEIDIMEYTANPFLNNVFGSYRWGTSCDNNKQPLPGAPYPPLGKPQIDWSLGFHTFSVEWNATAMVFAVDGDAYEVKTPSEVVFPTAPMYWILDTAIAWYWPPTPDAVYPAVHEIDWVRVSQCK